MLRYFEFGYFDLNEPVNLKLKNVSLLVKFIAKRFAISVFFIYATLFAAVATPFVKPGSKFIYAAGFLITAAMFARLISYIYMFLKFKSANLTFSNDNIRIRTDHLLYVIPVSTITFIEYNLFSNLVIHTDERRYSFPVDFLDEKSRDILFDFLHDMTPGRTHVLEKIYEFFDAIVMAFILAIHIIQFIVQNYYIPSGSMEDTLLINDHLFAEKLTYGPSIPKMLGMKDEIHFKFLQFRDIQKGDIIIFHPPAPADEEKEYIKRCIAVEGDEFHIRDNRVYVNGSAIDEPYVKGVTNYDNFTSKDLIEGIVPEGMVVAMGDNRQNSQDSRYFGYLPKKRIKAKALVLYFNWEQVKNMDFSRFGLIR
ncbi:MAG: signal peptidase I [Spirochaetes bacterium]|nr:signal peptidase I [Spirochaetota bacterium]